MGQCRPLFVYFRPFLVTISIIKSVDGVHGVQTRGRMMVVADKTTELWRPPNKIIILLNAIHRQLHLYFIEHQQNNFLQRVNLIFPTISDLDEGLGNGPRGRHHVLQGVQRHQRHLQRGRLRTIHQTSGCHNSQVCSSRNYQLNAAGKNVLKEMMIIFKICPIF